MTTSSSRAIFSLAVFVFFQTVIVAAAEPPPVNPVSVEVPKIVVLEKKEPNDWRWSRWPDPSQPGREALPPSFPATPPDGAELHCVIPDPDDPPGVRAGGFDLVDKGGHVVTRLRNVCIWFIEGNSCYENFFETCECFGNGASCQEKGEWWIISVMVFDQEDSSVHASTKLAIGAHDINFRVRFWDRRGNWVDGTDAGGYRRPCGKRHISFSHVDRRRIADRSASVLKRIGPKNELVVSYWTKVHWGCG